MPGGVLVQNQLGDGSVVTEPRTHHVFHGVSQNKVCDVCNSLREPISELRSVT